jgi:hypothetical protein
MSRPLASALVLVALSAVAGCTSSAHPSAVPHSLASQVPTDSVAAMPPPTDDFEFVPPQTTPRHGTKDAELTAGSLHAASPTRVNDE